MEKQINPYNVYCPFCWAFMWKIWEDADNWRYLNYHKCPECTRRLDTYERDSIRDSVTVEKNKINRLYVFYVFLIWMCWFIYYVLETNKMWNARH